METINLLRWKNLIPKCILEILCNQLVGVLQVMISNADLISIMESKICYGHVHYRYVFCSITCVDYNMIPFQHCYILSYLIVGNHSTRISCSRFSQPKVSNPLLGLLVQNLNVANCKPTFTYHKCDAMFFARVYFWNSNNGNLFILSQIKTPLGELFTQVSFHCFNFRGNHANKPTGIYKFN